MRGLFLTFEGLDGSGKSTHLRRTAEWLRQRGHEVVETHEPGGTALGSTVREIFLDDRWKGMDGVVELLLVTASRRQHCLEVIEPALAVGQWVLCDRFSDSTLAYQGWGRGVPLEAARAADGLATDGLVPDLTLLFDLPPTAARSRGQSPRRRSERTVDRLDVEALAFYERVRSGFLELAEEEPDRFRVIDSGGPRAETFDLLVAALSEWMENEG